MSRQRLIVAGVLLVTLALLTIWQRHREARMQACLERGLAWNGPASRCEAPRMGPILRRALERS